MAKDTFITFPASSQKTGIDSVFHAVVKFILGKFPQNVIRNYFVDTQGEMRNIYKNAVLSYNGKTSMNQNYQEMFKIPRPHMFVGYQLSNGFESNDTGLGETQHYTFPNAFWFQEHQQSQFPIFNDKKRKITISTSNLRIKATAEVVITCQNREEQFTIYNYVLNYLKMYYLMPLTGIKASFIMPDIIIKYIKDILYGEDTPWENCEKDLAKYLPLYSDNMIHRMYRNGKEDQKYYEMTWLYNRIDFRLSGKPQIDDGDKDNDAPNNFLVRFPCEVEFYIPTNYTVKTPELVMNGIGGIWEAPDAIKMDQVENSDLNDHVQTIIKTDAEDNLMRNPHLYEDGWDKVFSTEFAITDVEDNFNIVEAVDENLRKIIENLTVEQRQKYILIQLYEDMWLLDEGKYMDIDWNTGTINIHEGDILKVHTLEVYLAINEIEKIIKERKENHGNKHVCSIS